jgi:transcriptional regulator with XRE-family HTH domain
VARFHRQILGENIRINRKKARLSQEKLAEAAELSPKYLGEVERGCVNSSLDALVRISKALGVPLRKLMADI